MSPASVIREWNLLSSACNIAVREWRWLQENPMKGVRRPKQPEAREIERLLWALGYDHESPPVTVSSRVGAAMLFAIESALRAGEICALRWGDVFLDERYFKVRGYEGGGKTAPAVTTQVLPFFSFPFKGKAGMGMGSLRCHTLLPHPHPNPPLEGEGIEVVVLRLSLRPE